MAASKLIATNQPTGPTASGYIATWHETVVPPDLDGFPWVQFQWGATNFFLRYEQVNKFRVVEFVPGSGFISGSLFTWTSVNGNVGEAFEITIISDTVAAFSYWNGGGSASGVVFVHRSGMSVSFIETVASDGHGNGTTRTYFDICRIDATHVVFGETDTGTIDTYTTSGVLVATHQAGPVWPSSSQRYYQFVYWEDYKALASIEGVRSLVTWSSPSSAPSYTPLTIDPQGYTSVDIGLSVIIDSDTFIGNVALYEGSFLILVTAMVRLSGAELVWEVFADTTDSRQAYDSVHKQIAIINANRDRFPIVYDSSVDPPQAIYATQASHGQVFIENENVWAVPGDGSSNPTTGHQFLLTYNYYFSPPPQGTYFTAQLTVESIPSSMQHPAAVRTIRASTGEPLASYETTNVAFHETYQLPTDIFSSSQKTVYAGGVVQTKNQIVVLAAQPTSYTSRGVPDHFRLGFLHFSNDRLTNPVFEPLTDAAENLGYLPSGDRLVTDGTLDYVVWFDYNSSEYIVRGYSPAGGATQTQLVTDEAGISGPNGSPWCFDKDGIHVWTVAPS